MVALGGHIHAEARDMAATDDSIEVSLLTCAPHTEVYSLYGHTALRYHDKRTGKDLTFNYGVFNFNKPFFVLRFLFGLTDYELGVVPYNVFREEYSKAGRLITEQVINLTTEEKLMLYTALMNNYRPENRVYRYNYYYDNCTTRARDMIELCINGTVEYARDNDSISDAPSYREMIHAMTRNNPWAAFGDDLCLGVKSDLPTTQREQQFLPENLMKAFHKAVISTGGDIRPLVVETRTIAPAGTITVAGDFPLSPSQCAYILLLVSIAIAYMEHRRKTTFKVWDTLLLTCDGLAGIIIVALFFSEHPTTSTNLQVLLMNPLPLFFLPSVLKGKIVFWRIFAVLLILFFAGALIQDYAEGMEIVALCLSLRCVMHLAPAYRLHTHNDKKG